MCTLSTARYSLLLSIVGCRISLGSVCSESPCTFFLPPCDRGLCRYESTPAEFESCLLANSAFTQTFFSLKPLQRALCVDDQTENAACARSRPRCQPLSSLCEIGAERLTSGNQEAFKGQCLSSVESSSREFRQGYKMCRIPTHLKNGQV